ncbi:unnamed protein product [Diplocarpon coronariae]
MFRQLYAEEPIRCGCEADRELALDGPDHSMIRLWLGESSPVFRGELSSPAAADPVGSTAWYRDWNGIESNCPSRYSSRTPSIVRYETSDVDAAPTGEDRQNRGGVMGWDGMGNMMRAWGGEEGQVEGASAAVSGPEPFHIEEHNAHPTLPAQDTTSTATTMGSISSPNNDQHLIPVQIDTLAATRPQQICASIPLSSSTDLTYRDITYAEVARAINRAAGWIEEHLGRSADRQESFATLVYLGPFDIRYFVLMVAVAKVGYKLLLPSPRNSLQGQLDLFKTTSCVALLTASGYHLSPDLLGQSGLTPLCVPEIPELFAPGDVKPYPFTKTFEQARLDPFCVLHTSGSTGLPKPVVLTHGWGAVLEVQGRSQPVDGYGSLWNHVQGKRLFSALPPFHAAGIIVGLLMPLWYEVATVWAPSNRPLSTVLVEEVLGATQVDVLFSAPSILEDMIQSPESFEKLKKLYAVGFGGAPLDPKLGDQLCKYTKILNMLGSTESCSSPLYDTDPEDWAYFHFSPGHQGIEFRPLGDGTYEQVYTRHPTTDDYLATWSTFPEKNEYAPHDLYVKHPTKANLWKYIGRIDDLIVLSNGEKFNSADLEGFLSHHPKVRGALIVGQSRFCPGAIVELDSAFAASLSPEEKARFLEDELWPYVQEANERAPAHGQLSLDKIILASPDKPFPRAGKGTVQKAAAAQLYAPEIEKLYERSEDDEADLRGLPKITVGGAPAPELQAQLARVVGAVFKCPHELQADEDFFAAGMDSLHVMGVVKALKTCLSDVPSELISTRLIYSSPTLASLANALQLAASGDVGRAKSREQAMEEVLAAAEQQLLPRETVLLTGSTGSLGSYLLHTLLVSPRVAKIYCLNRRPDAETVQQKSNAEKGLVADWGEKVDFVHADLSKNQLALDQDVYARLQKEVTSIIHNQWRVDFNVALSSFQPQITGTLHLIQLSASSPRSPPIFFTSSIGTLGNWLAKHPNASIPETALTDPTIPLAQGYSESKWICERLLDAAGAKAGVKSSVLRVGQIAGPVETGLGGRWSKAEWLPSVSRALCFRARRLFSIPPPLASLLRHASSLTYPPPHKQQTNNLPHKTNLSPQIIASSKYLRALPATLGSQDRISWIPVDLLAQIIVDLLLSPSPAPAPTSYYHLENPHPGTWSSLIPTILSFYASPSQTPPTKLSVVPFTEWVSLLEASARDADADVEHNPGIKLLDFYKEASQSAASPKLETENTEKGSATMRGLKAVGGEWMATWLAQWAF